MAKILKDLLVPAAKMSGELDGGDRTVQGVSPHSAIELPAQDGRHQLSHRYSATTDEGNRCCWSSQTCLSDLPYAVRSCSQPTTSHLNGWQVGVTSTGWILPQVSAIVVCELSLARVGCTRTHTAVGSTHHGGDCRVKDFQLS